MRALVVIAALAATQTPSRSWRELVVVTSDAVNPGPVESVTRRRDVTWLRAADATSEVLASGNVALVGSMDSNRLLRELAPVELEDWYRRPGHVVHIAQRNPFNPDFRMVLVIGDIDAPLGRQRADVHIRRDGKTVLLGFDRGDGTYEMRRFDTVEKPQLVADGFRFFVHDGDVDENELRRHVVAGARADVHVYASLEEKGLITDDTRSAHVEDGVFHIVVGVDDAPARFIAETLMEGDEPLFGKRGRAAVAVYDIETLDRLDETARRLLRTSAPPSPSELHDDARFGAESPFVTDAVSASFARFVGAELVGERELDVEELQAAWARSLSSTPPRTRVHAPPPRSFQRGVTYAHMGYQIHNGYLSARGEESLSKLSTMGIDAVAIVPYTFVEDPGRVEPLEVPTRAGSETDEDVIHAIRRASAKGMTVLLKPQIWLRRGWPGDIELSNAKETERFFHEYRKWIVHYALMAEANDVPLLAVGTEMSKLTRGYRSQWQTIIEDIRRLYGGKLVYAANWGPEVQNVDFWDLLDYIGVDFYYPLSFESVATDEVLREGFDAALAELRKLHELHDKPVLLTEIGYASTKSPWTKPHASDKVEAFSAEDQARAYEIALAAVASETDWIHGMYWWKWPSTLDRGGDEHRGFTPNGKPAEDVLRRWYGSRLQ
jgi:hypothetical protein